MQPDEIVEQLAEAEGEVIEVVDVEGNEWSAYVDSVGYIPLAEGRLEPEGELHIGTDMSDDEWEDSPTEGFAPSIHATEDRGKWERPAASYHSEEDEYWRVEVERVEVIRDGE